MIRRRLWTTGLRADHVGLCLDFVNFAGRIVMRNILVLVLLLGGVVASPLANGTDYPPFPRLAGVNYGGPFDYDSASYQAKLAKLDIVLLNYWPNFKPGGKSFNSVVQNIKSINPQTKIFLYTNMMEMEDLTNSSADAWSEKRNKLNSMNWWLYSSGSSGSRVLSDFGKAVGKPVYDTNFSLFGSRDSSGLQYWQWAANWYFRQFYQANPAIDGFYEDNVFWKNHSAGDWNRDGTAEAPGSPTAGTWIRQAYDQYFKLLETLMPGKYQIGNMADWGSKEAVYPELQGDLNGGLMEGLMGRSYSPETWASWGEMMRWYRKTMAAVSAPKLLIFQEAGSPTDYKSLRYGLTSCLMDDAYFNYYSTADGYHGVIWFDEYDVNLGNATSTPPQAAWQNGVWRRDFDNGIALVNPRGNGQVTVTLETDFKHFSGSQAPSVNNGQATRTITLGDRDGVILLRTTAVASSSVSKPAAPQSVAVE